MTELIKLVFQKLSEVSSTYLEQAPQDTSFPFIVFKFPNSDDDKKREDFILEVNIWDKTTDTTTLESLTTQVENKLDNLRYLSSGDKIQTNIYRVNRLMIPDDDVNIRRRMIRFVCKTYFLK